MGMLTDYLRGKVDQLPAIEPFATTQLPAARAVEWVGGASGTGRWGGTAYGLQIERKRDYQHNATAARCVETIASNMASVDMTVLRNDEANDSHEVAQLWNTSRPDSPVSARVTRQVAFAQAELRGESFTYLDRGPTGTGPARRMWPLYDEIDVLVDGDPDNPHLQTVVGFVVKRDGQRFGLLPSEVLWLRYPHPTKPWHALAPWAAALGAAELDSYARAWQLGEFKNGAKPGMVVYLGNLTEQAHNAAVADFRSGVEGAHNAGKSLLVSGPTPANVSRLALTAQEMAYLESRVANSDEIMLAFGIRPDYFKGQSTYENQRAAKTALWSDLLLGKLDVLGSEVDRQLLPNELEQAAFDVSKIDALQENQDAISNRVRGLAFTDVLVLDELRAQLGYEPLPGGAGALTPSAYKLSLAPSSSAPLEQPVRQLRPRFVALGGTLRVVRQPAPKLRRSPLTISSPRVHAFYDAHEAIGLRMLSKLAKRQRAIVLRKLNKLRTSELASWETHREHAVDLAPDDDGVLVFERIEASPWSTRSVTDESMCDCTRIAADDVYDYNYWRQQTADDSEAWMRGVYDGSGAAVADALGVEYDVIDARVLAAMESRRQTIAQQISETTRRAIDSTLLQVTAVEGWSIDDAARALREVFDDLEGWRARTIARTEVVGGYNMAAHVVAASSQVVLARTWASAEDERVRDSHRRVDGERLEDTHQRYSNGLRFPGDPYGPAREIVNCRCVELYDVGD